VTASAPIVGDVRSVGLAIGVDIVRPGTAEPDAATAREVLEAMRERGVLIGTTGRAGNTLKIRPPLVFQRRNADALVDVLEEVLAGAQ
jgi:4-aminobutyrate aminotransferase-like enzyme